MYPLAGHGFFNRDPHFPLTLIESDKFLASLGWLTWPPTLQPSRYLDSAARKPPHRGLSGCRASAEMDA